MDAGAGLEGPAPASLMEEAARELEYWHMRRAAPGDRFSAVDGKRRGAYVRERRRLWMEDGRGRLVCAAGFGPRVAGAAARLGLGCRSRVDAPAPGGGALAPDWDNLARAFEPRPRQAEAICAMAAVVQSRWCGTCVAPTGFGKGELMRAAALLYPRARIVVTTASRDVAKTARAAIAKSVPAGLVGAGHRSVERCTVYVTRSLALAGEVPCDILIGDEAHELAAPTYAGAVSLAGARAVRIGLTATPEGRADGADLVIESLFGPPVFRLSYGEAASLGLVAPVVVVWHDARSRRDPTLGARDDVDRYRRGIWKHEARNADVAAAARSHGPEEQVLVLVDKVQHAFELAAALPEYRVCCGSVNEELQRSWGDSGLVLEDRVHRSADRRDALRQAFEKREEKRVIATGVWARGVNFRGLNALVWATGTASAIGSTQGPGRVGRYAPELGKHVGVVHDFRDQFNEGFRANARKRWSIYAGHGFFQTGDGDA